MKKIMVVDFKVGEHEHSGDQDTDDDNVNSAVTSLMYLPTTPTLAVSPFDDDRINELDMRLLDSARFRSFLQIHPMGR